jgi:hypothetical protein
MKASQAPGLNPGPPPAVVAPGSAVVAGSGTLNPQVKLKLQEDCGDARGDVFVISHGLSSAEAEELLRMWGRNELVKKATPTWWIIFRQVMLENSLCHPFRTIISFKHSSCLFY